LIGLKPGIKTIAAVHIQCLLRVKKPALPRRSIAVRFAPNKQTLTERVQCDAMCHKRRNALQQTPL
jgi:hypothetical protein